MLRQKWLSPGADAATAWHAEFLQQPEGSIDILFLGSSQVFCSIDPRQLEEQYGYSSFILGTTSQRANQAYFNLLAALKRQRPHLVIFDMQSAMYKNNNEKSNLHKAYDNWPLTVRKVQMMMRLKRPEDSLIELIVPVFLYHTRWKELKEEDYTYLISHKTERSGGALYLDQIESSSLDKFYDPYKIEDLTAENRRALDQIVDLCRENKIELLLWKTPAQNWRLSQSILSQQYADSKMVPFWDMTSMMMKKLDGDRDFSDNVQHLNIHGMKKVTSEVGNYLSKHYDLPDRRK